MKISNELTADCFSTIADLECQYGNDNNHLDEIFYRDQCRTVQEICEGIQNRTLTGVNVNYCFDQVLNVNVPISQVITRTLSAEEFF